MGSYGFGISDKQYLWLLRDFMTDIYIFLGGGFNPIEKLLVKLDHFPRYVLKIYFFWNHHLVFTCVQRQAQLYKIIFLHCNVSLQKNDIPSFTDSPS